MAAGPPSKNDRVAVGNVDPLLKHTSSVHLAFFLLTQLATSEAQAFKPFFLQPPGCKDERRKFKSSCSIYQFNASKHARHSVPQIRRCRRVSEGLIMSSGLLVLAKARTRLQLQQPWYARSIRSPCTNFNVTSAPRMKRRSPT